MKRFSSFFRLISIKERLRLGTDSSGDDPGKKYTPGRAHDGTIHVWMHHSVVGNSFRGKLFVDGSLMGKRGAQGGQTGRAVAEIKRGHARAGLFGSGAMPISLLVQRRIMRAELWALL